MIGWLQLTDEQRRTVIGEAEQNSGIPANVIEKDWWVTLTLKALFQSQYSQHMVFKGGTSLSKGWDLIARFSEDIDIALDPAAFGMAYTENPTRGFVNQLKRAGCDFTTNQLRTELENQFRALGVPDGILTIEAEPVPAQRPDTDPQTLYVNYNSLYPRNEYVEPRVKIEVSVRSLSVPSRQAEMQTILNKYHPLMVYGETPFSVETVEPRKTFLEKIFLLHEEFSKPDVARIRTERMSRHLYDLGKIMQTDVLAQALSDHALYEELIQHREWYSKITGVDYATHSHNTVSFIPPDAVIEQYRSDYQTMLEEMIYEEEALAFDALIAQLKILQGKVRLKNQPIALEEVFEKAVDQIKQSDSYDAGQDAIHITSVVYLSDPYKAAGPDNQSITLQVTVLYSNGQFMLESIST